MYSKMQQFREMRKMAAHLGHKEFTILCLCIEAKAKPVECCTKVSESHTTICNIKHQLKSQFLTFLGYN
jgi:hypothetical protein